MYTTMPVAALLLLAWACVELFRFIARVVAGRSAAKNTA
jgi:hypothetical protein